MKARQLEQLGIPSHLSKLAKWSAQAARSARRMKPQEIRDELKRLIADPDAFRDDEHLGDLARAMALRQQADANASETVVRDEPVPYAQWGDNLEPKSVQQMAAACKLPVAVRAALMPDAHLGYGLPIGGVLATENAVVPYAVGVDIACRMKLTVLDLPTQMLEAESEKLAGAIEMETRFGIGSSFKGKGASRGSTLREHPVMDEDWSVSPITRQNKDKAHQQLGASGSGNHFVEFGLFTVDREQAESLQREGAALPGAGTYLALLSHSGSRGTGASVCSHYSKLAMSLHPNLPKELKHLAWLDMDSHEGQEYWAAMNLMGHYAAANHACIHRHIAKHLGAKVLLDVENHHNFAWKETHEVDGEQREVYVHRKGATPADAGVLGIIPGSMADPCYLVRGRGNEASLRSAAHGAGRVMSRTKARQTYRWNHVKDYLQKRGVRVLSAGLDEAPMVYKNIDEVMAA